MKDFKGKVMVVTGAGNGIGAEIAKEGALRGMNLVLNDIDGLSLHKTALELQKLGVQIVEVNADITLYESVRHMYDVAMETFGRVDILINNAGVAVSGPIWMLPVQDINWITEANFLSHAYGMNVFLPKMIEDGNECWVLNVSSGAGVMISGSACMYHSTKFADVALAETTYLALKDRGINNVHVHVLAPAFVQTEIHLSDKHRPERYSDMSDVYYQSQEYTSGLIRSARQVQAGIPVDSVGLTVFNAFEDGDFYIFTHPEMRTVAAQRIDNMINGRNP